MVDVTVRAARTTPAFSWCRRISRAGGATSPSDRMPVATWYSSGWNRWWLVLPMTVRSTGARLSALAANRPPKPEPTMTTRGRPDGEAPMGSATGDVVMMNQVSQFGVVQMRMRRGDPGHCPAYYPLVRASLG